MFLKSVQAGRNDNLFGLAVPPVVYSVGEEFFSDVSSRVPLRQLEAVAMKRMVGEGDERIVFFFCIGHGDIYRPRPHQHCIFW